MVRDVWAVGDAYEAYVGRWSRRVAADFVPWLGVAAGRRWLDVGCGTGALTATVLAGADPDRVLGVDPSVGFLSGARAVAVGGRAGETPADEAPTDEAPTGEAAFVAGDARSLPLPDRCFDAIVSGLALNFVPEPGRAAAEIARVLAPGGVAAAYVWDYAEGMAMMRYLWDAATEVDPKAAGLDEGRRFPLCQPEPLRLLWTDAGLADVEVRAIEVPTVFADFDDYWRPFLGGQGAAPAYLATLDDARRDAIRDLVRGRIPSLVDGSIPLRARVWAVRGTAPG
jgi:SAM-dependent methyltransferase